MSPKERGRVIGGVCGCAGCWWLVAGGAFESEAGWRLLGEAAAAPAASSALSPGSRELEEAAHRAIAASWTQL